MACFSGSSSDEQRCRTVFRHKFGYYNADCLDVLVSDTYAGNGSIDMAQWTSVKDQFTFPEGPANGYNDNFVNVGKAGLEAYNGKSVYVAFRYVARGPRRKPRLFSSIM